MLPKSEQIKHVNIRIQYLKVNNATQKLINQTHSTIAPENTLLTPVILKKGVAVA